jgi:hypothetical protein
MGDRFAGTLRRCREDDPPLTFPRPEHLERN